MVSPQYLHINLAREVRWKRPAGLRAQARFGSREYSITDEPVFVAGHVPPVPSGFKVMVAGNVVAVARSLIDAKEAAARHALDTSSAHERLDLVSLVEGKLTTRIRI